MGNSAYNHPNDKGTKCLTLFNISDTGYNSEYGLYNSTGQLLKGSEFFEQYSGLAKQLDTKRSAFYLKLSETEIIFGCSLIVKSDNGREERVVFIQANRNLALRSKFESNIQLLKKFYEEIKSVVENLDSKKYRLIGLWNEGDFRNIEEILIKRDVLEYTIGKIYSGKKVYIKISELNNGLSLILKLIIRLRNRFSFTFDISQYPSESDVSISLIKPNPDFEIGEGGTFRKFTQAELWSLYRELGEEFFKDEDSYPKGGKNQPDPISPIVKKILREPISYCSSSNSILDDYNDGEKVEILQGLVQKVNNANDSHIRKILVNIYRKIKAPERKKDVHKLLISKNIYIEEFIEDLVLTIYKEHNSDLLNLLFNNNISQDNSSTNYSDKEQIPEWARKISKKGPKYNSFEKGIKNALNNLEYSEKVNFVKLIASEVPSKPKTEGKILLQNLVEDLVKLEGNDFIFKLSDGEVKNLDEILNTDHLATKKKLKREKRNWIIKSVFFAGLLVTIIYIASLFVFHIPSTVDGEENNSSNNKENNSISVDNNSVSNIPEINFTAGENNSSNNTGNSYISIANTSANNIPENNSTIT